eukprot:scaffold64619_cov46-Attheya_sp.AAC.2
MLKYHDFIRESSVTRRLRSVKEQRRTHVGIESGRSSKKRRNLLLSNILFGWIARTSSGCARVLRNNPKPAPSSQLDHLELICLIGTRDPRKHRCVARRVAILIRSLTQPQTLEQVVFQRLSILPACRVFSSLALVANIPSTPTRHKESCFRSTFSGVAVSQTRTSIIQLVYLDENIKNKPSGPGNIDRHGCAAIDLNGDLKEDLVCTVGADGGDGVGFNEVYLTQEDGTLSKTYPTLREREIYPLKSFSDGSLLLLITKWNTV